MRHDLAGWTIVIDLDGTLVETAPDLHGALNHVLAQQGLSPIPLADIRPMIGDGAKALIRKGLDYNDIVLDEAHIEATLLPAFLAHYQANITRLSHLYEGAPEALSALQDRQATLAICTNKAQALAEQVLQALGIRDRFAAIVGGDRAKSKKPEGAHILETVALANGDADRAIMIGDSQTDERAAYHAELPFIMVTFGYGNLSGAPLHHLEEVDHWSQIEAAINRIALNLGDTRCELH